MSNAEHSFFQVTAPHERALVRVLAISLRRRLNTAMMVDRLAHEFTRGPGRALRQVARLLAEGTPIVDSLEQTPRALDPTAVLLLRLAAETGTLPETLQSLVTTNGPSDPVKDLHKTSVENQLYQVAIGFMMAWLMITFLLTFIIPTFKKMFEEFGVELPATMLLLIAIGDYWLLMLLLSLIFFMLLLTVGPFAFGKSMWPFGLGRRIPRAGSDLLALFAIIIQSGRPLASGIDTLSRIHPVGRLRKRLVVASTSIDQGEDAWQALATEKIIGPKTLAALQLAEDKTAQAWLLRRAARLRKSWTDLWTASIIRFFSMALLLMLAAIVMLAAVAVFMSVYGLVDALAAL
ncbi:type II secretion system F family protein [Aporhodopirellula aestuarii]|uniref:Type II secretion system F family protein n=1 Tax=Aporhodopirellula aestuarii TaxID=2950107 RepID=A0ABT0U3P4_9BACT|nr:type II secretion system F family protein [Aporhodopirellula aestuarii]MCM2371534.1 type II secretion system F family protein [Aporhodopirellula aestuarii]